MSYEIFEIKQHLLYITDVTEMDLDFSQHKGQQA